MFARLVGATAALAALLAFTPLPAQAAATITIINLDGPGEGFNDPTPATPVGGNTGTTIGAQRLIAFQYAANVWGAQLNSTVEIRVRANFDPLTCTATSAVLGSAGPWWIFRDFTGAPVGGHWYHNALANKLAAVDLSTPASTGEPDENENVEIGARFNSNLGQTGCLTGTFFYYGLDNNHGAMIDLVTVVLHELGHGLGFSTTTSGTTGAYYAGFPSIYDRFALDIATGKLWDMMTDAERAASAVNARKVVWNGGLVTAAAPTVLQAGTPQLGVAAPPAVGGSGTYMVGTAAFGPPVNAAGVTGHIMPVDPGSTAAACAPLTGANAAAAAGNIALIDRGTCAFTVKVKNAQDAGAVGVIIADNVAGSPPSGLGGSDPTITIPAVRITQADGNTLKSALRFRSRTRSGVIGTISLNLLIRAGADAGGRVMLYTPNPFVSGSSVSHWDSSAIPNLLMEPNINADLTHSVIPPQDLTLRLLQDIGWTP